MFQVSAQGECADTYSSFSESEDEDTSQRMLEQLGVLSAVLPWDLASNSGDPSGAGILYGIAEEDVLLASYSVNTADWVKLSNCNRTPSRLRSNWWWQS